MITTKSIYAYRDFFNTTACSFAEPSCQVMIFDKETDKSYISPFNETDEIFLDRLERCKKENKNLFYEEWEEFKGYDSNCIY